MSVFCLLIVYVFCEFIEITYCVSEPNSTSWSTINLLVDSRELKNGFANVVHTTETYGIIIKSTNSSNSSANASATPHSWTKIEISKPPQRTTTKTGLLVPLVKYHAKLGAAKNQSREETVKNQTSGEVVESTTIKIRSMGAENASTEVPRKGVHGETGHAFFYDDDDDDDYYDDDDDDDYDDDGYRIKNHEDEEEEEEEVIEPVEPQVEEPIEAAETEAQEEYESYPETRPPIILRTRRKNKPKRGKKHTTVKVKDFKKLRKFLLPLLLAYKLKFFTLVPLLLGGLVLIVATTGFAGFFFALFAVGLGLRTGGQH